MKLFVIIDRQYNPAYRGVQAGHAVAEYLIKTAADETAWKNETLIYLISKRLDFDYRMLAKKGLTLYPFYEPDQGGKMTAFACYSDDGIFQKFEMA